jgi:hypothetical protein
MSKRLHLEETSMPDEKMLVAAITVGGTLVVSVLGSFMGSRLARRTRWRERMSEALPKFYAASTVAWYAWQRYMLSKEEGNAGSLRVSHYYDEHINSYRDLLSSAATLALELKGKDRQAVWDLLDLWEATSDPHNEEHENRWRMRCHELLTMCLALMGKTDPPPV